MKRIMNIFLISSLIMGTCLVIYSKHWFPIWLGLELSTLSILPLLNSNTSPRSNEATIKYFLVQAFSAAILLKGATLNLWLKKSWEMKKSFNNPIAYKIIILAVMIKLGLAPCHYWFPDVLSGLSFMNGMIIACWQKIAPLFMLLSMSKKMSSEMMMLVSAISVLVGGWGGLNQMSMRKMLAYSSISHLGWISATLFFLPKASLIMFIFYMLKNTAMFLLCHKKNLFYLSNLKKTKMTPITTILFSTFLLSLGGLPPLGGFIKKLMPLTIFLNNIKSMFIPMFIFGSLTSLYFYLRMVFNTSLTLFPKKSLNIIYNKATIIKKTNLIMSILTPLPIWGIVLLPLFSSFM